MSAVIETYKNKEIRFDTTKEKFYFNHDGEMIYSETMKGIRKKVDGSQEKFDRFEILNSDRWSDDGKFQVRTVTSINAKGEAWTTSEGCRSKIDLWGHNNLILNNPFNVGLTDQIMKKRKEIKDLDKEIEALEKKFDCFDIGAYVKKVYGDNK